MISGVPTSKVLYDTAYGWLNLAWSIATRASEEFQDINDALLWVAEERGVEEAERIEEKHWNAKRLALNNAVSLLQQSLEIFLKAKIAEISPFLLISGDPKNWPKTDDNKEVDFSRFRTLDAVQLIPALNILSIEPIDKSFEDFFNDLRTARNRIIHLNAQAIKTEVKVLLADILRAQKNMLPAKCWMSFRKEYLVTTEEFLDKDFLFNGDDLTREALITEFRTAIFELEDESLLKFFDYDSRKEAFFCPVCIDGLEFIEDDCEFVQAVSRDCLRCCVCRSEFSFNMYKQMTTARNGLHPGEEEAVLNELNAFAV